MRITNISYCIYKSSTVIISLFFFCWMCTVFPFPKPSSSSHFPLSLISGTMMSWLLLFWNLEWILSFLEFIMVFLLSDKFGFDYLFLHFSGCTGGSYKNTWTSCLYKPRVYDKLCFFWISKYAIYLCSILILLFNKCNTNF